MKEYNQAKGPESLIIAPHKDSPIASLMMHLNFTRYLAVVIYKHLFSLIRKLRLKKDLFMITYLVNVRSLSKIRSLTVLSLFIFHSCTNYQTIYVKLRNTHYPFVYYHLFLLQTLHFRSASSLPELYTWHSLSVAGKLNIIMNVIHTTV